MSFAAPRLDAITRRITYGDLRAWRKQQAAKLGKYWYDQTNTAIRVKVIMAYLVAIAISGILIYGAVVHPSQVQVDVPTLITEVIVLLVIASVISVIVIVVSRPRELKIFRFKMLAQDNGLEGLLNDYTPNYPGMVLQQGDRSGIKYVLRTLKSEPRFTEVGNFWYQDTTTDSNGQTVSTRPKYWGYVAIRLEHALPNIVLDAKVNNTLFGTNLPERFTHDQILHLEGDFDRYFTLYTPKGYEADALYLFTPEVMATFIDQASAFDAEIVDDWLFLYTNHRFDMMNPRQVTVVFAAIAAVRARVARWARWRDDRLAVAQEHRQSDAALEGEADGNIPGAASQEAVPDNSVPNNSVPTGVAPQGKRLRHAFNWIGIVILLGIIAVLYLPNFLAEFT